MAIGKKEVIRLVGEKSNVAQSNVKDILNALVSTLEDLMEAGEEVTISGFLNMKKVTKPAGTFRNPKTGEEVEIGEREVIKVKLSKVFGKNSKF